MSDAFAVRIGEFEGPLDLLLNLIEERKMLISDISLTQVADDFLSFIQNQTVFPLGQAAHFVVVAATLLLLKSRALLPVLTLSDEEEGDVRDLEFRLALLQVFRGIAKNLSRLDRHMEFGSGASITEPLFIPPSDLSIESINAAGKRVLMEAPTQLTNPEVTVKTVVSLEEMMDSLSARIEKAVMMTFKEFTGSNASDRYEIVVGFLAMLELVKRGLMNVQQENARGDITMSYRGQIKPPRYE